MKIIGRDSALELSFCSQAKGRAHIYLCSVKIYSLFISFHLLFSMQGKLVLHCCHFVHFLHHVGFADDYCSALFDFFNLSYYFIVHMECECKDQAFAKVKVYVQTCAFGIFHQVDLR